MADMKVQKWNHPLFMPKVKMAKSQENHNDMILYDSGFPTHQMFPPDVNFFGIGGPDKAICLQLWDIDNEK